MAYFHIKRALKQHIRSLEAQKDEYEALKIKTIARNKKAHDIFQDPNLQKPINHPLYAEAQEVLNTAQIMMNESAELIQYLEYCINECTIARNYFVSKLSVLII